MVRSGEAIDELLDVDPCDLADEELAELTVAQCQSHRLAAARAHRSRTAGEGGLRPRPLITILVGEASFAGSVSWPPAP